MKFLTVGAAALSRVWRVPAYPEAGNADPDVSEDLSFVPCGGIEPLSVS